MRKEGKRTLGLFIAVCVAGGVSAAQSQGKHTIAPDPTVSDGDKYHVILENEHVRVLRYHDAPGDKTHLHHHPHPFVMYALAPFDRELTFPDGSRRERHFGPGSIDWVPAQTHVGQNIGNAPTEGLIIEVKSCVPAKQAQ